MDDDSRLRIHLDYIFSFLEMDMVFPPFHFALKGPQNFKGQVQSHIWVDLQVNGFCDSEWELVSSYPP